DIELHHVGHHPGAPPVWRQAASGDLIQVVTPATAARRPSGPAAKPHPAGKRLLAEGQISEAEYAGLRVPAGAGRLVERDAGRQVGPGADVRAPLELVGRPARVVLREVALEREAFFPRPLPPVGAGVLRPLEACHPVAQPRLFGELEALAGPERQVHRMCLLVPDPGPRFPVSGSLRIHRTGGSRAVRRDSTGDRYPKAARPDPPPAR